MKALVWTEKEKVEFVERDMPDYAGKVLIKVAYAGICGSDVSIYLGKHPRAKTPLIMGHEFTGTVQAIGEGVTTNLAVGDKVVVNPLYFCGRCRACLAGNTHVCKTLRFYGIDTDGGMAEYAAIPESCLLKLPEDMDFKLATLIEPAAVVVHGLRMIKKMFYVDVCIANEEDAKDVFGIEAEGTDLTAGKVNHDGYISVARQLTEKFGFEKVAITLRASISASDNEWAAMLYSNGEAFFSPKYLVHIVDRVGGGLIYALLCNYGDQKAINFAVAASCLKHSIEHDFNLMSVSEVESLAGGNASGRVQR